MKEKIAIVDDERATRDLFEGILTAAGYATMGAKDGTAALAQVTAAPPDLILLDLPLPGMGALELCDRLKRDPATRGIPIIVVTALEEVTQKEAALTRGAEDFLLKPVDPADLLLRVQAVLKVRSIRQELQRSLAYLYELETVQRAQRAEAVARLGGIEPVAPPPPAAPAILLVHDESLARRFYADLLVEQGYQVFATGTGADAVTQLRDHPLEVVLLDMLIPGMAGLEILERLHAEDPDLPVIMLVADTRSSNVPAALKLGAFDFVLKGLESDLLALAVHRAVAYRRTSLARQQEVETLRARIAELEAKLG